MRQVRRSHKRVIKSPCCACGAPILRYRATKYCSPTCGGKYPRPRYVMTPQEAFDKRVRRTGVCWLWIGRTKRGYGQHNYRGRSYIAHRYAYILARGPIPAGLVIDHLCHTRACVNPAHLDAVTSEVNARRAAIHKLNLRRSIV